MSKHRWTLIVGGDYEGWRVQCRDCGEYGMTADADAVLDEFYTNQERRCETCKHFHANTYTCDGEWAPLKCVLNDFSDWETRDE